MSKIYRCEKNHLLDAIEMIDEDGKCLCPHDNTRCHLEADTDDKQRVIDLEKQNSELVTENERMKCCWNCKSSGIETDKVQNHTPFQCDKWNEVFYDLIPCEHWKLKE